MYSPGFFPNGYLGKPLNYGYYLTQALGEHYGFDPHATPWNEMSARSPAGLPLRQSGRVGSDCRGTLRTS